MKTAQRHLVTASELADLLDLAPCDVLKHSRALGAQRIGTQADCASTSTQHATPADLQVQRDEDTAPRITPATPWRETPRPLVRGTGEGGALSFAYAPMGFRSGVDERS